MKWNIQFHIETVINHNDELENKFYNAGKAQGSKFSMEQRIKTSY